MATRFSCTSFIFGEPGNHIIAIGHRGLYRFPLITYGEVTHTDTGKIIYQELPFETPPNWLECLFKVEEKYEEVDHEGVEPPDLLRVKNVVT